MPIFDALLLSAGLVLLIVSPMTGSFLKCWADRAAVGQSVADGRSYCDSCGKTLSARDLVPILSWLWNRGKSRCCHAPLRWTLLTPEITSFVLAVWAALTVPFERLLPALLVAWLLQAIALLAVPATRTAAALAMVLSLLGLLFSMIGWSGDLPQHLLGFALGLLVAAVAWSGAADPRATTLQAATLLPPMGALLGVGNFAPALAIGLVAAMLHMVWTRFQARRGDTAAPVATSLSIGLAGGIWLVWLYGDGFFNL